MISNKNLILNHPSWMDKEEKDGWMEAFSFREDMCMDQLSIF